MRRSLWVILVLGCSSSPFPDEPPRWKYSVRATCANPLQTVLAVNARYGTPSCTVYHRYLMGPVFDLGTRHSIATEQDVRACFAPGTDGAAAVVVTVLRCQLSFYGDQVDGWPLGDATLTSFGCEMSAVLGELQISSPTWVAEYHTSRPIFDEAVLLLRLCRIPLVKAHWRENEKMRERDAVSVEALLREPRPTWFVGVRSSLTLGYNKGWLFIESSRYEEVARLVELWPTLRR